MRVRESVRSNQAHVVVTERAGDKRVTALIGEQENGGSR